MNTRPELTYDGHGINGPDEYRTRVVNFQTQADADKYGKLLAAAPDLLAACKRISKALRNAPHETQKAYQGILTDIDNAITKAEGAA
jgi:hypothetical protein